MNIVEKYFQIPSSYVLTERATREEIFDIWSRYPTAVKFSALVIHTPLEELNEKFTDNEKADLEEILAIIEGKFGEFWDAERVFYEMVLKDVEE
jgi:hypothetical protein